MIHAVDWFPTILELADIKEGMFVFLFAFSKFWKKNLSHKETQKSYF